MITVALITMGGALLGAVGAVVSYVVVTVRRNNRIAQNRKTQQILDDRKRELEAELEEFDRQLGSGS